MLLQIKLQEALKFEAVTELLQSWRETKNLRAIREFHANVIKSRHFSISPNLQFNLLISYTECISGQRRRILTGFLKWLSPSNPLPFNAIISYFSRHGPERLALHTFSFMHHNSVFSDSYALCSSLKSASVLENVCLGKVLHAHVEKSGWLASVFVGSALVDFYSKTWCLNDAVMVFDEIPEKNTVCVNALMSGYSGINMWDKIIDLVRMMPLLNLDVDNFTLSMALRTCCGLCALELSKQVHAKVIRRILDVGHDVFIQSLLIESYGRCGLIEYAKRAFNMAGYEAGFRKIDVILWTSILGAYGRIGNYTEVTNLFNNMLAEGVTPDDVAFLSVISACSYTGQVNLGMKYFESMINNYGLAPTQEHYSCIVDMLCRAGDLERACTFVSKIPCDNGDERFSVSMWGALLSACNESGRINLGKVAAKRALELDPSNVGIYVLLSNIYARNGMWYDIEQLREEMKCRGLKKQIGRSYI